MNYSQSNEQEVILNYFGDKIGTFADIGCNDCITFSNSRALALKGWKGIFVDPSKAISNCHKLYEGYKGLYIYPYGLSNHNGKDTLYESGALVSANDQGLVSTMVPSEMDRFKRTVKYEPTEIKVFKWKTFLNRLTIKEFDFISIDVEGAELQFLPDMDLSKTSLICLENNGSKELKNKYLNIIWESGLNKVIYESGENIIVSR